MIKLTRRQTVGAMTGLGLLTAGLSFGDSALRFMTPAESASSNEVDDGKPTVVHNVEHRSGTQDGDVLTGSDTLVITPAMVAGEDDDFRQDLEALYADDLIETFCTPANVRIHNTTDQYVNLEMSVFKSSITDSIGIGPGERANYPNVGIGEIVLGDQEGNFWYLFRVSDCG